MKKWTYSVVSIVVVLCISVSCRQSKSLQELLQEESKAIDKFISMNDFVILRDYPKDGVFKSNEYYKTTDGLFLQVVDSGNGTRAKLLDEVSVRYDYFQYIKNVVQGDSSIYLPSNPYDPDSFVYGITQTYSSYSSPVCQAWIIPLSYVGEGAVMNLIVPSTIGSYVDRYQNIAPVFYKNLRYTRFN